MWVFLSYLKHLLFSDYKNKKDKPMIGKKFTSLVDGRVVEIKDVFEDIIILNDNSKVKASRLLDRNFFEEYIDPRSFFSNQSLLDSFAQKIKQIPDEVVHKMSPEERTTINESLSTDGFVPSFNESAVLPADPELEKEELMRKYGIKNTEVKNSSIEQANKQLERFQSLIQELQQEDETDVVRIEASRQEEDINFQSIEKNIEEAPKQNIVEKEVKLQEDPIITMFKNVKRNKDFKITVDIVNKIPRPDFIEMMEDSYNTSIIEFLANEFTSSIINNPNLIKEKIVTEIKNIVYGKTVEKEEIKLPESKKVVKARTPRTKKQVVNNDR